MPLQDEDELMDLIIDGDVHMDGPKWEMISPQAKDLVRGLLEVDPKKRLTAVEAIEHPWFTVSHPRPLPLLLRFTISKSLPLFPDGKGGR